MNTAVYDPLLAIDSWGIAEEADRRFKRIVVRVLAPVLACAIVVPWIQFELAEEPEETPPQIIELLPDPLPPPEVAKVEPPPREEPKPAAKPRDEGAAPARRADNNPTPAPAPSARQIAEQSGFVQFREQLSQMRSQDLQSVLSQQNLADDHVASSDVTTSDQVAASAAARSGGVDNARAQATSGSGTALGTRRTGSVQSPIGTGNGGGAGSGRGQSGSGDAPTSGRSLQEIQLAFDRSKSSFFAIFNRMARENPGMEAGKIVVSLTIAPDGSVTRCELVSSSFDNAELEQKILQRVKLLNFGAKNVPPFTYPNYPINFLPS